MSRIMLDLKNKNVLVIGLDGPGRAACVLLRDKGAAVTALDSADTPRLRGDLEKFQDRKGIVVKPGARTLPDVPFDFAVRSADVPGEDPLVEAARERGLAVISDLELGYQQSLCLNISVTGTTGRTTTTELIEQILLETGRKTLTAGYERTPVCSIVGQTRDLDFLTLEVSPFELEDIEYFRPLVAVLLNLAPDHLNRYPTMADYVRAHARLFANQQAFDWAIIQSEALAHMRSLNLSIPSKTITFSANNRRADIFLDRGLLVSRLPGWAGPLFDMDHGSLRGPHYAETVMAALAVGHVLRLPLETMTAAVKDYRLRPHRVERIAEINGVEFIDDSRSTNLASLHRALLSIPEGKGGLPNVWLIAGGRDKKVQFHDIGPLLSHRVKGVFLMGEAREKIRAAWSLFTPCTLVDSLLEAVQEAARNAVSGDIVLLSPACSSYDQFQSYQHRGEVYRKLVETLARPSGSGGAGEDHNRDGGVRPARAGAAAEKEIFTGEFEGNR